MSVLRYVYARYGALDLVRLKRLSKEGAWIVMGQAATVVGALVLVRVLTEHLTPTQYGELALGLTIAGLVNQAIMGGVTAGIGRFYSIAGETGDLDGYLGSSRRLIGLAVVVVCLLGLILMAGLLWMGRAEWVGLAWAVLLFAVLSGLNSSLSGVQNAARQRSVVALHKGMDAWLKIGFAVGMMLWVGASSVAVVVGYTASALAVTVSQLRFLRRLLDDQASDSPGEPIGNWTRRIWSYSWPFSVWGVFTWAQQVSDRWSLETFASTQDVGQYAVIFQLGYTPIGLVTGMAMSFLGPILYQRSGAATDYARNASVHRLAWGITLFSLTFTGFVFLVTLLLHEWLFQMLVAAPFRGASHLFPWVVLAGGIFAAGQMIALKLMSELKASTMTMAKIVSAVFGIGFNAVGAWRFGLSGVVAGLLAFSILYFVWMALLGTAGGAGAAVDYSKGRR